MSDQRSIKQWLDHTAQRLSHIERSRREAQLLLMAYLKVDELYLMLHADDLLEGSEVLENWIQRRCGNEPLEYILKKVSFYSQEFFIRQGALIPRPETELLIDEVLRECDCKKALSFVEVGIGSGIISIVLAQHFEKASFIGIDLSEDALSVAQQNIQNKNLSQRIALRHGSLLEPIDKDDTIDVLVSNPPYIAKDAVLESNLDYEPNMALFGGDAGDELIKALLDQVLMRRIPLFICEFGYDQKEKVRQYLENETAYSLRFYQDLSGFDRGFILKRKQ